MNIIFIVNSYSSFQKDLIESIAPYCENLYVFVRYRIGTKYLKYFKFLNISHYDESGILKIDNLPANVKIFKVPVILIPIKFVRDIIYYFFFKGILKIIMNKKIKFDLIHSVFTEPSGKAAYLLSEHLKKPLIHTLYEDDNWLKNIIKDSEDSFNKIINKSAFITSNSSRSDLNILKKDLSIIYNGHNNKLYYQIDKEIVKRKLGLDLESKYIINISTMDDRKNQDLLINAFNLISKKYPDLKLILIGDGTKKNYLMNKSIDYGIDHKIIFAGFQPHNKLNDWINSSEFFVLSSKAEGNPTVMFETLGTGTPFITTNVGGVKEIINDDCGIVVENFKEESMAKAIELALNKKWDRDYILNYMKEYEISQSAKKYIDLYKSAINGNW